MWGRSKGVNSIEGLKMIEERDSRNAGLAGLASVVLFFIGWFIYGSSPTVADEPAAILKFFTESHDQVIWSMFAQGIGALAMIWFMAVLVLVMIDENEAIPALIATLSFAIALTLGSAATIMRSGLAFISVGDISPDTVAVIFYLGSVIDTCQNIFSAGFFLAVGYSALCSGFLTVMWGWVSILAGLYAIATTTALDHSGFWSPHQAGFLNLVFYIIWVGGTSVLLMKRKSTT